MLFLIVLTLLVFLYVAVMFAAVAMACEAVTGIGSILWGTAACTWMIMFPVFAIVGFGVA